MITGGARTLTYVENLFQSVVIIITWILNAYILSLIIMMLENISSKSRRLNQYLESASAFMIKNKISKDLQYQISYYIDYNINKNQFLS
jgi:hypothetical protein